MSNNTLDDTFKSHNPINIKDDSIKFGIIGGLAGVIFSLITYFTDLQFENWTKWISTLIMVAAIVLGIKSITDSNKGNLISFGTLFKAGMIIAIIIAVISIIYFFIYTNFIETDFIDKILEVSRKQMAEKGLSEEQIDTALKMSKSFMSPGLMVVFSLAGSLIFGALASVVGAAIFKNEK